MNIQEEKRYIYEMMREITTERRVLSEMYMELKSRLSELDKLQERGFEELDVEGLLELSKNKSSDMMIDNLKREMSRIEEVKGRPVTIPKEQPKQVEVTDIQESKDVEQRINKSDSRIDNIKVMDFIASYIRRTKKKMNSSDMRELIKKELEIDVPKTTMNNIVFRMTQRHKDIKRVKFGVYGYRKPYEKSGNTKTPKKDSNAQKEQYDAIKGMVDDMVKPNSDESPDEPSQNVEETLSNESIPEQQNLLKDDE